MTVLPTLNNDKRHADFMARVAGYGKADGEGRNARPAFGRDLFLSAADGVIEADKAGEIYGKYVAAAGKKLTVIGKADTDSKSLAAQVSKMKNFISVGSLPFFKVKEGQQTSAEEFFSRIDAAIAALAGTSDKSVPVYDKMVSCMVAQKHKVKDGHAEPLTDEEIADAINPTKEKEDEQSCLERMRKALYTSAKKFGDSAEYFMKAGDALTPRINTLALIAEGKDAALIWDKLSPEARAAAIASQGLQN